MSIFEIIFRIFSFYFDQIFGTAPYPPESFIEAVIFIMAALPTFSALIFALFFRATLNKRILKEISPFGANIEQEIKKDQKEKIFHFRTIASFYFLVFFIIFFLIYFIAYKIYDEGVDFLSYFINIFMYDLVCTLTFILIYYIFLNINPPYYIKAKIWPFYKAKYRTRR